MATGHCLCGGVRYEIAGALTQPIACHCSQCAHTSGNFAAMAACKSADLKLSTFETLRCTSRRKASNAASARAAAAICSGGPRRARTHTSRSGRLDRPTGLRLGEHIYVGSKSDFYDLTDGLPQKDEW